MLLEGQRQIRYEFDTRELIRRSADCGVLPVMSRFAVDKLFLSLAPLIAVGAVRDAVAQAGLDRMTAGGVAIASNPAAGCALWSWVWNGVEFINVRDYGREIQSSIALLDRTKGGNPTEAGNRHSDASLLARGELPKGSKCVLNQMDTTTSAAAPVQRTLSVPLEWDPDAFGGSRDKPIPYNDFKLGKELALNFAGMGPVAEYRTVVLSRTRIAKAAVEIPAIYLRGDLTVVELYDARSKTARRLRVPKNRMDGVYPDSGWGGLIACNESGTFAFGIYGVLTSHGGSVTGPGAGFQYGRFVDPAEKASFGSDSHTTTKINALAVGPLISGRNVFRVFLMTGTRAEVERKMAALAAAGDR
jgi:hypothetical protein